MEELKEINAMLKSIIVMFLRIEGRIDSIMESYDIRITEVEKRVTILEEK